MTTSYTSPTKHTATYSTTSKHSSTFTTVAQSLTSGLWIASVNPWQLSLPWQHSGIGSPAYSNQTKS